MARKHGVLALGPGSVVEGRFEIERAAGSGGMSAVFRAQDRLLDRPVALKVLTTRDAHYDERFHREAGVLAGMTHPGVARYIAHGRTPRGELYLAMEWIEGEDLGRRLARQPLARDESLAMARSAAEALAAVHRRGVVHRDVKPTNLLLRDGRAGEVTLIDFGLAWGGPAAWRVTQTGEVVGTLQYLAPEQARGEVDVGPAADVFSLGCVLYECLTGRLPFGEGHAAAMLARVLFAEAPPLAQLVPGAPAPLAEMIGRMLAKKPEERYPDGAALVDALAALGSSLTPAPVLSLAPAEGAEGGAAGADQAVLGSREQQLVSVVVAVPADEDGPVGAGGTMWTRELVRRLEEHGAEVECLPTGALVATLAPRGEAATDQALLAVRCALLVRAERPLAALAVATGHAWVGAESSGGAAAAGALALFDAAGAEAAAPGERPIWLDALTARLAEGRYQLRRIRASSYLLGEERPILDPTRPLLGRPTPCLGREQELAQLELMWQGALEGAAQAALVTAPPGVGKSRLAHEFMRRREAAGAEMTVLVGRGDPLQAGAAYGLLGQALRRHCHAGHEGHEGHEGQAGRASQPGGGADARAELAACVGQRLGPEAGTEVVAFLGELCGIPFPAESSARLRAAREDPRLMSAQITEAFVRLLGAECARRPVLLVLEDLHWADGATVRLVDVALRELGEARLMVLALARPEVRRLYPRLWEERGLKEVRLGGLGRRASERLARAVLGDGVPGEAVARIIEQAGGNVLYLEELIRAVAEGAAEELPASVLAMFKARLVRLDPEARRILWAASVFGQTFWRGGLGALCGEEQDGARLGAWLPVLVDAEIIVPHTGSRLVGEAEYGFRHALMREAVYDLLTEEDRRVGHRGAALYLERAGESDPAELAEHFRRGGEDARAAEGYTRAAVRALAGSDAEGALERVAQALACGAEGELLGTLRATAAWAHIYRLDLPAAYEAAVAGWEAARAGSADWYRAASALVVTASLLGRRELMLDLVRQLYLVEPLPGAGGVFAERGSRATCPRCARWPAR